MREYIQRAEDLKEMLDGQQTTPDGPNGAQAQSARPKGGGAGGGGGGGGGNAREVRRLGGQLAAWLAVWSTGGGVAHSGKGRQGGLQVQPVKLGRGRGTA